MPRGARLAPGPGTAARPAATRPRILPLPGSGWPAWPLVERNLVVYRRDWVVFVTGFLEPLLYLLSIGIGVGRLVGDFRLADGRIVTYAAFVAPAMLAASAMNGALAETTFNFFGKMKYMRLYDAVLATPVSPVEIAMG